MVESILAVLAARPVILSLVLRWLDTRAKEGVKDDINAMGKSLHDRNPAAVRRLMDGL